MTYGMTTIDRPLFPYGMKQTLTTPWVDFGRERGARGAKQISPRMFNPIG